MYKYLLFYMTNMDFRALSQYHLIDPKTGLEIVLNTGARWRLLSEDMILSQLF